jgi:pimeloyl-ACP methyl ester carboxylesterase
MNTDAERDRRVEEAQAALLERYAPDTRVRRVRWSQGETQVLELGSGSPLLLVHGGGDSAMEWVPILPALARNHRVIAVDRPGHGLADPFDYAGVDLFDHARTFLREILDVLELPTVDIAANSMGGLWSVVFALAEPDRVGRLAIVGAPPGVTRDVPLPLLLLGLPLIGQALGRHFMSNPTRESSRKFWGQLHVVHPERLTDEFLDADVAHTRRNVSSILSLIGSVGSVRRLGLKRDLVLGDRWQELTVPTQFLCGEHDVFVPPKVERVWQDIAARNPNVGIVRIPDAGHVPWIDDPERVVGELERFLVPLNARPTAPDPHRRSQPVSG